MFDTESVYAIGGSVQAGNGYYIARPADKELITLCRANTFAYVLAPRQVGKSSLMIRTARTLEEEGIHTAVIDLNSIGTRLSPQTLYFGLLQSITDQLHLKTDVLDWWEKYHYLSLTQRFSLFFEKVLLVEITTPIVVFIDEIDTTLSLRFTDDFFASIRAFYDARSRIESFHRLTFVLIGVATPSDLVRDPKRTPFNIGQRVEMTDFTIEEALPLTQGLPTTNSEQTLRWILYWTGGHPYLTQRLCRSIAESNQRLWIKSDVDRLVHSMFFGDRSAHDTNLQFVRDMLTKRAPDPSRVLTTYRAILQGKRTAQIDEEQSLIKSHLKLAGIVYRKGDLLQIRNNIYREVFNASWIRSHLPGNVERAERIQRARNMIIFLSGFSLIMMFLTLFAWGAKQDAERANALADARALVIQSRAVSDPELSLLLATEAGERLQHAHITLDADATGQIEDVLHNAIQNSYVRKRLYLNNIATGATWSPNGKSIVTASVDNTAQVWDAETGQVRLTLQGHSNVVNEAAYSPDGKSIVTASQDNTAKVWDAETGQVRLTLANHTDQITTASWSPDGKSIVTASADKTAKVWDATTGRVRFTFQGHSNVVNGAVYSPDGKSIVTASADKTAKVWDAATGQVHLTLQGHSGYLYAVAYSPDGKSIVTASVDNTAKVWDSKTGQLRLTLQGHNGWIGSVAYSPDGKSIVTASADKTAKIWDAATGQELFTLQGHTDILHSVGYSPDGRSIITASSDNTVRVWDAHPAEYMTLYGHTSGVNSARYSPDGKSIVTASQDNTAKVWDAETGQELFALQGHTDQIITAAWSPDGKSIVTASADKTAKVWDAATGQELRTLQGHSNAVNGAVFSPDGKSIVTASADMTAKVWDAATGQELRTLQGHSNYLYAVAYSPDGKSIVTASADNTAKVWDAATGRELRTLRGHNGWIGDVAYSPDGKTIVTASADKTAKVWDAATDQELFTLQGHTDILQSARYSPDGRSIITASRDKTVRVWDAATGRERVTLHGARDAANSAEYSPNGHFIVAASNDSTVRMYEVQLDDLLSLARTHVSRTLTSTEQEQLAQFGLLPALTHSPRSGASFDLTPIPAPQPTTITVLSTPTTVITPGSNSVPILRPTPTIFSQP
jgi:WD40 repeat protein